MIKITVLSENVAGGRFLAEHGLSYLVEHNGQIILFDTGHSDVFLKNAQILGLDIQKEVNTIILSHGHWDHGNGLRYLKQQTLIAHPLSFIQRFRKNDNNHIGLNLTKNEIQNMFILKTSKEPLNIAENILFLGEIPRLNDFEAKTTSFVDENGNPDFVPDDSALAIIENNELTIITGCSHSGICNIISYAIQLTGIPKVKTVIGGFHLKYNNQQTQKTIEFFKELNIENIYPSHCTELEALLAFAKEFKIRQLKTGIILDL